MDEQAHIHMIAIPLGKWEYCSLAIRPDLWNVMSFLKFRSRHLFICFTPRINSLIITQSHKWGWELIWSSWVRSSLVLWVFRLQHEVMKTRYSDRRKLSFGSRMSKPLCLLLWGGVFWWHTVFVSLWFFYSFAGYAFSLFSCDVPHLALHFD